MARANTNLDGDPAAPCSLKPKSIRPSNPGRNPIVRRALDRDQAKKVMTVREVATYLNCRYSTVYRMVYQGVLRGFRLAGCGKKRFLNEFLLGAPISTTE